MEATAAATHTSTDISFAAYIADKFGGRLLTGWQGPLFDLFGLSRSRADLVLRGVVGAVRDYHREVYGELPPELPRSWRREYVHSISAATRVIGRTPSVLGGVPILARTDSPVEGCAVFNVFSPLALQALALSTSDDYVYQSAVSISEAQSWRAYAREYVPKTPWVKVVEPREASRGFMALLADSARTAFRAFARTRKAIQPLVIDGRTYDYLLRVTDEFAYDPVAFGSRLTYKVSGVLRPGRYRFEGVREGRLLRQDPTTYLVTEDTTELFLDGV